MKRSVVYLMFLIACSNPSEKSREVEVAPIDTKGEVPAETAEERSDVVSYQRLNNETAIPFLKDFGAKHQARQVIMKTDYGIIEVELFEDTPIHRANFLYLIERKYFCPTQLVRIVPHFVIQGGNSEELEDQEQRFLIGDYTLPSEMQAGHLHYSGALAMSRSYENNPAKRSSPYDFYIVEGDNVSKVALFQASEKNGKDYTETQSQNYFSRGGAPHLDNEHTVFGKVTRGMDVVGEISKLPTDASEWPIKEVEIMMEVLP